MSLPFDIDKSLIFETIDTENLSISTVEVVGREAFGTSSGNNPSLALPLLHLFTAPYHVC